MPGIPSTTYGRLRAALFNCGPFESDRQLSNVFTDARIKIFRPGLPEADTRMDRVDATIAYLADKQRGDTQENALVLLLYVLCDRTDSADACHMRLAQLAKELESTLSGALDQTLQTRTTADVLLVTATHVEAQAILDVLREDFDRSFERRFVGNKTYHDLGEIGGAKTYMVQSEMGSSGPSGSLLTIEESIRALAPSAVIMVGIAFGIDEHTQQIGDILISRQLLAYELQRVGTGADGEVIVHERGDRPSTPTRLLDRFRSGCLDWQGPRVQFGVVLSGDKLVDHRDFRAQLQALEPEAIGGEMEGAGLYAAAQWHRVDWILVKAICDWADGHKHQHKSAHQQQAAHNAARFTFYVLRQGGFVLQ